MSLAEEGIPMVGRNPRLSRLGASLLSLILAIALVPTGALPASAQESVDARADATSSAATPSAATQAASTSATSASASSHDLIAQAEEAGECASGQALVVYHASGAAKGSTGDISVQSESDPLASAGFGASKTWDLSGADGAQSASDVDADGALTVQSAETGSTIASGSDVRVALVERDDLSTADLVDQLESLDFVECASPNYYYHPLSLTNDTFSDMQYGLASATAGIDEQAAFDAEKTDGTSPDVVAVLDTGVDYNNPDLAGDMWTDNGNLGLGPFGSHGYDAVHDTYNPMPASSGYEAPHGTHCAGIIAAQANNKIGVAGVAGNGGHTQIMGLRCADNDSNFSSEGIAGCYQYLIRAALAGVNVVAVNDSWGSDSAGAPYNAVLDYMVNQAGKAGVISCFAAGNDAADTAMQHDTMLESPYAIVIASSNSANSLSSFSSYDTTEVDVAAPGSNIISTLSNADTAAFCALYSHELGKHLEYYSTVADETSSSSNNFYIGLLGPDGTRLSAEVQKAMKYATTTDDSGQTALKVTIDFDALDAQLKTEGASFDSNDVSVGMRWDFANPFKGRDGLSASDYRVNVKVTSLDAQNGDEYFSPGEYVFAGGTNLVEDNSYTISTRDNYGIYGGSLASLDTTSDTLTAQLETQMYSGAKGTTMTGSRSFLLEGFGIGRATNPTTDATSAFVPYGLMSGTSMATPMIAGAIGELASLYPDDSALELRGRVCGGTTPLATTEDAAKIASGGRFTFANALNSANVNANTWSITTEGTQVTVHGYNLKTATLSVDGKTVTPLAQSSDAITFEATSGLLDGASHRFDVTDAVTGRTYNAAYVTPTVSTEGTRDALVRVHGIPVSGMASTSVLVAATDRLFLADGLGGYLYSCTDPSDSASPWTQLSPATSPWAGKNATIYSSPISYAYSNGHVYAMATDEDPSTESQAIVRLNDYDIQAGTWSGWTNVGTVEAPLAVSGISMGVCDGTMYCSVTTQSGQNPQTMETFVLTRAPGSSSFAKVRETYDEGMSVVTSCPFTFRGSVYTFETKDGSIVLCSLDLATGKVSQVAVVSGYGTSDDASALRSADDAPAAVVGNGIVLADGGIVASELGDLKLVGPDGSLSKVGSFGINSPSAGLTITSVEMFEGRLYLNGFDDSSFSSDKSGIYTLPASLSSSVAGTDVTAAATVGTDAGGAATVADWRGSAASSLDVRSGDTATWTAAADASHTFVGWYDEQGTLVSTDATYSVAVSSARTLTARFAAKPAGGDSGNGSTGAPVSRASATSTSVPSTGDETQAGLVCCLALLGIGLVALGRRRSMRQGG